MEMIELLTVFPAIGALAYLAWKNHCLKRDIYGFTQKLDAALDELLNGRTLDAVVYQSDDLWGRVYEKMLRISKLYAHKNEEIYEEKKCLKELVSDLSHQTKTPLANIKLYIEMLSDETTFADNAKCVKKMSGQADKLEFLLQSMVKMSRLETGTIKVQKKKSPVSDTLAMAIGAVVPKADKKKIQIHVEYDENLLLSHDSKWTAEAIFNILDNAVKYTDTGGKICISVIEREIFTEISIRDTGKGIALERQGAVFNRFYREPETHDSEGIGIGLYVARKIISMQNGYIEVNSEIGQGSNFIISLPN